MASNILKISALAFLASASVMSASQAGGFGRGSTDTDILYEEGNFNIRAGATYVNPTRKYTVNANPALVGTDYASAYLIPSGAVKLNINDDMRCAGTYAMPFGGQTDYAAPTPGLGKLSEGFTINEFGLTCGYKFDMSKGRAWILGGVNMNLLNYDLVAAGGAVSINLKDTAANFRIGAAYEIPEIALRAQIMYTSGFGLAATGLANGFVPASGAAEMPQNVELKVQSGVAPGWLVFGSVKWTDWSVTETLDLTSAAIGGTRQNLYYWSDGWTVSAGVGHAFNEKWSGAATITWDKGVGTGYDLSSDTWTFGVGGSYKDDMGGELKFGTGVTYIAAAAEDKYGPGNSAVGSGWAYALGASYKTKW